ncbi:phosphatase PAP2 family protein [Novosphingobium sp. G106]|uniref:acid phosphatase n=1 Tax=Novosphingobium sp. G106 TaxID=2849500 RepID=UPI001C2DD3CF|nr:phosphatase PAP2 family protein [Novosphingobium sp. G106]MBV1687945.1 phosphatase PAP2 family protein [Novosphingobium sp. G106]
MRRPELALAVTSIALLLAVPVAAKEDHDTDDVSLLTAADLDPAKLLPAPPAAGSAQAQAELAELHTIETARSETDVAAAKHDSETKNASIFAEVLGPSFDLAKLPATREMFEAVRETEKDAANRGKAEFRRPRPWIVEDTLKTCSRDDEPLSSYPSGHTTMAYSMGAVLARLVPAKAPEIMARAAVYGQSRIVCEQHFRSDVTAGEALGLIVAERLMAKPRFQRLFEAASRELKQAGLL